MKRFLKLIVFIFSISILIMAIPSRAYSQKKDKKKKKETTSDTTKVHSPKKATYLALVPGLGQIYNKKYWKLPIVYAGFGVTAYLGISNRREFLKFNDAYTCSVQQGEDCSNELAEKYSSDELQQIKNYYQRNMELSFIVMGAWYILQILDASVDAHLYSWEVDEDLSVELQPVAQPPIRGLSQPGQNLPFNGIKVSFKF